MPDEIDPYKYKIRDGKSERLRTNAIMVHSIRQYWETQGRNVTVYVCPKTAEIISDIQPQWKVA